MGKLGTSFLFFAHILPQAVFSLSTEQVRYTTVHEPETPSRPFAGGKGGQETVSKMKAQRQSAVKRRPLLAHARPSRSTQGGSKGPLHNQAYDVHTGQVFSEVEVPVSKKQSSDWIGELKTPGLVKSRLANARGARSLFDMAKTTVTRHIRSIHSHYLAEVPWEIAEQIWNEVTET